MKVYSDFKGDYILIRKPIFKAGTEFMVVEEDDKITLIKINQ